MNGKGIRFVLDVDANISNAIKNLNELKGAMQNTLNSKQAPGLTKLFTGINNELNSIREKAATPIKTEALFKNIVNSASLTEERVKQIGTVIKELQETTDKSKKLSILPEDAYENYMKAVKGLEDIDKANTQVKESLLAQVRAIQLQQKANEERVRVAKKALDVQDEEGNTAKDRKEAAAQAYEAAQKHNKEIDDATKRLESEREAVEKLTIALKKKQEAEAAEPAKKLLADLSTAQANAKSKKEKIDNLETELKRSDHRTKEGKSNYISKTPEEKKALKDQIEQEKQSYDELIKIINQKEQEINDKKQEAAQNRIKAEEKLKKAQEKFNKTEATSKETKVSEDELQKLKDTAEAAKTYYNELQTESNKASEEQEKLKKRLDDVNKQLESLKNNPSAKAMTDLASAAREVAPESKAVADALANFDKDGSVDNFNALRDAMQGFVDEGLTKADEGLKEAAGWQEKLREEAEKTRREIETQNRTFEEQNEKAGQVSGLVSRIQRFTGLAGAALIARKALRSAFQTIKELDEQMTKMAVVTNLEVGDYWKQLPQHTARANELGMAIKDVYEAETLYYQQGLKTAEVTKLSTSTLKMARIAGLSAEDATNKMTAALRGFNMEINETNADRIADVYSKLAAITASNVQEISSAMTKTASIASNAGMEFETTAAFLSQIIETTRESAETAGTALKTVIARFQELKKSPEEIGEVDGEIVDANKIETALRSVGVALRDAQGQFRDLDDVFLELSGKWDTLDMNTQRYIATIAAGSRQQSRFVAMMSNYSRTQELVTAANNAAGASNEQFSKTLESLESKLAALKNAWDNFTMGLMNSSLVKGIIDILTGILNGINKVTDAFGDFGGSAAKIGVVTVALIAGDKALKVFMASMKAGNGIMGSVGAVFKAGGAKVKSFFAALKLGTKAQTQYIKTSATVTKATQIYNNATNTQKAVEEARKKGIIKLTTAENAFAKTEAAKAAAAATAAKAYGLNTVQQAAMNGLLDEGIPLNVAAAAAQQGLNKEKLEELALTSTDNALQGLSLEEKKQKIAAMIAEKAAEDGVIVSKQKGLLLTLAEKAAHVLEKLHLTWLIPAKYHEALGIKTATAAKEAEIPVTVGQTSANIGLLATLWPILAVMLLIAAAVLAAIAIWKGLQALFAWFHSNTPEGKFEAASEALEKASDVAEQATEKYNNLKDSLNDLNDKYDALDEMTVGTQEWRDALLEVNSEVMDLIDKYPKLADAMEVDANGVMRISEEAQKQVLQEEAAVNARAQSAKLAAQINKNEAKANLDYSNLSDKAVAGDQSVAGWAGAAYGATAGAAAGATASGVGALVGAIGGAIAGAINGKEISRAANKSITDELAMKLANPDFDYTNDEKKMEYMTKSIEEGGLGMIPEQAQQWLDDLDDETLKELQEYGRILNENAKAQEAAMQAMIANSMTMIDTDKYSTEQLQQMNNIGTDLMESIQEDQLNAIKGLSDDDYEKRIKDYYSEFGKDVEVDSKGNVTYKDEEGNEVELTKEQAQAQLAAADATDEMAKKLELLPSALMKAQQQQGGKALERAFNDKEGKGLTKADLDQLKPEDLKALYDNNEELQQIYGDYSKFQEEMEKRTTLATQAFAQNAEDLAKIKMTDFEFDDGLSASAEEGLIEHLSQVVAVSGPEVGEKLGEQINGLLSSVSVDDGTREKLAAQLNAIDWHDADALEKLPETIEELGITGVTNEELEEFAKNAKEAAQAVHNIDMTKLNENLTDLTNILENIRVNKQGRTFESGDYEKIIEADSKLQTQFVKNLDGSYTYLGSSMDTLTDALLENTEALIKEKQDTLQNQYGAREILDEMKKEGGAEYDISKMGGAVEDKQREFLEKFIENANKTGADISKLSTYLSNETDLETLNTKAIEQIIDDLRGIGTKESIEAEMKKTVLEALTTTNLKRDAYYNTHTESSQRAEKGRMAKDDVTQYQSERRALISQAQALGISEQDLKRLIQYNEQLEIMEDNNEQNTAEYKKQAKEVNKLMNKLASKSSFQAMYEGLKENVEQSKELLETYNKTSDAAERMYIVSQMMNEFGIEVTEDNYERLAALTDAYLRGSEQGFIDIVNMSGEAAGLMGDVYEQLSEQTEEAIEAMGEEYLAFANQMVNAGYAYFDAVTKQFTWGTRTLTNIARDSAEKVEMWQNPYDWLYNANQRVNAQIRERNLLEKEYSRMIEDNSGSVEDLTKNINGQLNSLSKEGEMYANIYKDAKEELTALMDPEQNPAYAQLLKDAVGVGPNGAITVDKEKLYAAGYTSDQGGVAEDMIGEIESLVDTMTSAQDSIEDTYDAIRELEKSGKEEYTNLLDRVTDALKQQYQEEIDKLSNINDAINDANEKLLSKMQEQIDEQRDARSQEEALQNLQDKQARLAYLRASGGSQVDILSLEKEIANDQQSYEDSLVDKALSEMEKANQAAADQRQQQIDIAQAQYDWWEKNKAIQEAEQKLNKSLGEVNDTTSLVDTDIGKLLYGANNVAAMSKTGVEDWYKELGSQGNLAAIYTNITTEGSSLNTAMSQAKSAIDTAKTDIQVDTSALKIGNASLVTDQYQTRLSTADIQSKIGGFTTALNNLTNAVNSMGSSYNGGNRKEEEGKDDTSSNSSLDATGRALQKWIVEHNLQSGDRARWDQAMANAKMNNGQNVLDVYRSWIAKNDASLLLGADTYKANNPDFSLRYLGTTSHSDPTQVDRANLDNKQVDYYGEKYIQGNDGYWYLFKEGVKIWDSMNKKWYYDFPSGSKRYGMQSYATGGLADFTGPAWLDGTKAAPELVLNATDTANFIQLKDILAEVLRSTSATNSDSKKKEPNGDNYYDIDVHVDSIESDYDVDQAVERMKEIIEADAMYRNVNAISQIR